MSDQAKSELRALAAHRAGEHEFYLASALIEYQRLRKMDEASLTQHLGCDLQTLDRLRLCRRPGEQSATFRTDVQAIAQRFGISAITLAQMLREIASLQAIRSADEAKSPSVLMAARDRKAPKPRKGGGRAR